MQMRWNTQNDATDAEGFLLDGEACFTVELALLESLGCPDTATAALITIEVIGRDDSLITADVSDAMAQWLEDELDGELTDE